MRIWFALFLFFHAPIFATDDVSGLEERENHRLQIQGVQSSDLLYDDWQQIAPFLLPDQHPAKKKLDKIFNASRVTKNLETLRAAGFETSGIRQFSNTIVATHPKLSNYIIKLFLDDQPNINEATKLCNRVRGANLARLIVNKHHFNSLIKVPRKWIYVIPSTTISDAGPYPKHLLLIAENMHILEKKSNYSRWKSKKMTAELLTALYILVTEGGFYDAPYAFNLPFSTDGRIAVIDTEEYNGWPIPYERLDRYLNEEMNALWHQLTGR